MFRLCSEIPQTFLFFLISPNSCLFDQFTVFRYLDAKRRPARRGRWSDVQLDQLRAEQDHQMRQLLKQVKEQEKKLQQKELAHVKQLEEAKGAALAKKAEMDGKKNSLPPSPTLHLCDHACVSPSPPWSVCVVFTRFASYYISVPVHKRSRPVISVMSDTCV